MKPPFNQIENYSERLRTPLLDQGDAAGKRAEFKNYFLQTYSLYESLFELLNAEPAFYLKPDPLRHPLIFYYCHTAVFFINKCIAMKLIKERINPKFESMFAVGIDEMNWDDYNQTHYDWPTLAEAKKYRDQVKATMLQLIDNSAFTMPITWGSPEWIILMGIEHERIHLETSSVLIRQLPLNFVKAHANWSYCTADHAPPKNQLISVPATLIILGKALTANTYGWDNEYGEEKFNIDAFAASQYLVSNHEFLEFVKADGYATKQFWEPEGLEWREGSQVTMPRFWRLNNSNYFLRTLTAEIPMPWSWPVEVNYHEAKAFCNWLSAKTKTSIRLPTEAEWNCLYQQSITEHYPQWQHAPGNIDLAYCASSVPVDQFKQGNFHDVIGNVWQWTETAINGFPGFKPHPAYDDFSLPTFEGLHNLIKGGSWISTGNEALASSRYAFRRHFYQHAGFRYVKASVIAEKNHNYYETDKGVSEYLEFHFGETYFNCPHYLNRIVNECLKSLPVSQRRRALDLGCAVGRASFECAKYFNEVKAIDFSTHFIRSAVRLQQTGRLQYAIFEEGELTKNCDCNLADFGVTLTEAAKIEFMQGDACNLRTSLGKFDLVIASNLIDRLYNPQEFLNSIAAFVAKDGILAIASPYTWLAEHTPPAQWLGGIRQNGEPLTTFNALQKQLQSQFELIKPPQDIEFVLRETRRKFQHSIAELSLWRKL